MTGAECWRQEGFRLASIFSDGMVLQRTEGSTRPRLWGYGTPNTHVTLISHAYIVLLLTMVLVCR